MIDLHDWPTAIGKKATIRLAECGLPYTVVPGHIGRGDQCAEAFLRISPDNRIPAIVDHEPAAGGEPVTIFESGAIMPYLAGARCSTISVPARRRPGPVHGGDTTGD